MVNQQSEFWSKVADNYDQVVDLQIGPKTRSLVLQRLASEERLGKVIEFGCGTGFYSQELALHADSILATDISPRMLELAQRRVNASNVTYQLEDCQKTTLANEFFDTVFISLVLHFTEPETALQEIRRILKPGGKLMIANIDPNALKGLDRIRCLIRILYHGLINYRIKPPKGFAKNVMTEKQLCDRLVKTGFKIISAATIKDASRSSNVPVEYITAVKA